MKNVQDIYPTSPMQELMLLHALGRRHTDTLLTQFVFAIEQALDAEKFELAWHAVIERHSMLRTAFVVDKVKSPLQVVRKTIKLPFAHADWRDRAADVRTTDLESLCAADRADGFDPRKAPLMRLTLLRFGENSWRMIWTSHHLLMDRWCLDDIFADLASAYQQLEAGTTPNLAGAPSYKQYIDWLSRQDRRQALDYWRDALRGFEQPTHALAGDTGEQNVVADHRFIDRAAVQEAARRFSVTPGALLQAATALLLAEKTQRDDVVFGTAAAARPPAIAGVERIVGSFVSNLPVRVRLASNQNVGQWLSALQRVGFERSDFEYLSPVDISACASLRGDEALFDTLLVWLAAGEQALPLGMRPLNHDLATAYPLTLSVADNADSLTLHAHLRSADDAQPAALLERLVAHIEALCHSTADTTVGDLITLVPSTADGSNAERAMPHFVPDSAHDDVDKALNGGREMLSPALLEQLVATQFMTALGTRDISPDDDFFARGGDSLRAASLHGQICAGTRKNVPLLALFKKPSIRGVTDTLLEGDWPMTPGIALPLRTTGSGGMLFCVASPEVNTLGYFVLSRHLSAEHNVCVLQAPPATDQQQPMNPDVIDPLAAEYVEAMRKVQPRGPYRLLGMCGGAHLALAMARQLEHDAQSVRFFGIVNTWSLYSVSWVYYLHRARNVARYYASRVREKLLGSASAPAPVETPPSVPEAGPANEDVGLGSPWIRDVGFAHRLPRFEPLSATVQVFRLQRQQYWRIRDNTLGWGRFFSDTKIVPLSGNDHDRLLREPHVEQIAGKIDALLDGQPTAADQSTDTITTIETEPVT
ncbi:MAG: condensation domain-containing protein [Gammaproteobacteria bacterium]